MADISLPHLSSGKVRDIYDAGDGRLLLVTSDRISAFDVIMAEPIPDKGRVLTAMSAFWFELFADLVPGHLISTDLADMPPEAQQPELTVVLTGRAQTIRAIRAAMKAAGVHRGRTVVRSYWDEKRSGLD